MHIAEGVCLKNAQLIDYSAFCLLFMCQSVQPISVFLVSCLISKGLESKKPYFWMDGWADKAGDWHQKSVLASR